LIKIRRDLSGVDNSFGTNGVALDTAYDVGWTTISMLSDKSKEENGKILVGLVSGNVLHVCRYFSNGTIDTRCQTAGSISYLVDSIVQPDQSVILSCLDVDSDENALRYLNDATGTLDPTFGLSVKRATDSDGARKVQRFGLLPDGSNVSGNPSKGGYFRAKSLASAGKGLINASPKDALYCTMHPDGTATLSDSFVASAVPIEQSDAKDGSGLKAISGRADGLDQIISAVDPNGCIYLCDIGSETGSALPHVAKYFALGRKLSIQPVTVDECSTNPGHMSISGRAPNPSNVYIMVDGSMDGGTATIGGSENVCDWHYATNASLSPGPHTIEAVAIYQNGRPTMTSCVVHVDIDFCVHGSTMIKMAAPPSEGDGRPEKKAFAGADESAGDNAFPFKPIRDVMEGDFVAGADGEPIRVAARVKCGKGEPYTRSVHMCQLFAPGSIAPGVPSDWFAVDPGHPICSPESYKVLGQKALIPSHCLAESRCADDPRKSVQVPWDRLGSIMEGDNARYDLVLDSKRRRDSIGNGAYIGNGVIIYSRKSIKEPGYAYH
jgi:hypothetical protein